MQNTRKHNSSNVVVPVLNGAVLSPEDNSSEELGWLVRDWQRIGLAIKIWFSQRSWFKVLESMVAGVIRMTIHHESGMPTQNNPVENLLATVPEGARETANKQIKALLELARQRFRFWWEVHSSRIQTLFARIQGLQNQLADVDDRLEKVDSPPEACALQPAAPGQQSPGLRKIQKDLVEAREIEKKVGHLAATSAGYVLGSLTIMAAEVLVLYAVFSSIWGPGMMSLTTTLTVGFVFIIAGEMLVSGANSLVSRVGGGLLLVLSLAIALLRTGALAEGETGFLMSLVHLILTLCLPVVAYAAAKLVRRGREAWSAASLAQQELTPELQLSIEMNRSRLKSETQKRQLETKMRREQDPRRRRRALERTRRQVARDYRNTCSELESWIRRAEREVRQELRPTTRQVARAIARAAATAEGGQ